MGLETVGMGLSLVSGVAGASRQSASLREAAAKEREIARYNSALAIYNAEGRANKVQFDSESQVNALERNRVLDEMNTEAAIRNQDIANEEQLGKDTAQLFGTIGDASNPLGEIALAKQRTSNILQKRSSLTAQRYKDSTNLYSQNSLREQGTIAAFNERQQGIFQSSSISAPAFASASSKEAQADGIQSSALFNSLGSLATGPLGGALGVSSIFSGLTGGGGGSVEAAAPPPLFTPGITSTFKQSGGGSLTEFNPFSS